MLKGLKYIIFLKKNVVNCLSGELSVQSISVMIRYVHCKLATVKKLIKADISSSSPLLRWPVYRKCHTSLCFKLIFKLKYM